MLQPAINSEAQRYQQEHRIDAIEIYVRDVASLASEALFQSVALHRGKERVDTVTREEFIQWLVSSELFHVHTEMLCGNFRELHVKTEATVAKLV